jgi:hypothetical protein
MAKRKQRTIIPFTEEGMRTFKDVNEAVDYFEGNFNIEPRKTVSLFQNTFMISVGKISINVLPLQELNESEFQTKLGEIFKNLSADGLERIGNSFSEERKKWNNKFKD